MRKSYLVLAIAALLVRPAFGGWNDQADDREYRVVINHEEQYSVWFADQEAPRGWKETRFKGTKKECLDHIEEVWTDMRPLSWRRNEEWGDWSDMKDGRRYRVVINHEEQYSVWFADQEPPRGWKSTRLIGSKKQCLDHIEEVWTDMRPLSWRKYWRE
jgi:MbtH protein